MKRLALSILAVGVAAGTGMPTAAQAIDFPNFGLGLFKRKQKEEPVAPPTQHYVTTLQSDPDEQKRLMAASGLANADPRVDAAVIPTLIHSLQRDPSPLVRSQAAEVIGKLKPIYLHAGLALQTAAQSDPTDMVRKASKAALWEYHLAGYRPAAGIGGRNEQTPEPPIANPVPGVAIQARPQVAAPVGTTSTDFRPIAVGMGKGANFQQTVEPPIAAIKVQPAPVTTPILTPSPRPVPTPIPNPAPSSALPMPTIPGLPTAMPATAVPQTAPVPQLTPSLAPTLTPPPVSGKPNPF
ncbi:MAG: HEAT repeat domain-containing protein [Bacteroidales bacterium]|nr:HEAT repeat domain-containing protein [Bacteroidales bacterium]